MLTARMAKLLRFIDAELRETGICPSFNDMAQALGLRSKSGVYRILKALDERGFIRRLPGRVRAIEVVRLPESPPTIVRIPVAGGSPAGSTTGEGSHLVCIPHFGRLATGLGPAALAEPTGRITVSRATLPQGECFAMDFRGDSMKEAGILEGDTVLVVRTDRVEHADIVLAAIDVEEIVLRRLLRKGRAIALAAANVAYETRIFGPDRVSIIGRMCGLIRRYPDYRAGVAAAR